MHSEMSYHNTMTHQYTVNVQRSYTCTQGINNLYTTIVYFKLRSIAYNYTI